MEAAAYSLTFEVGMDSERVLDYAPVQRPYGGYLWRTVRRAFGWGLGYTTYMPYVDTVYTHWLRMRLYATKKDEASRRSEPQTARRSGWAKPSSEPTTRNSARR